MAVLKGQSNFTQNMNENFQKECKEWVRLFTKIYQSKDVTPYMHVLAYHIPEELHIHGNINIYSQQGMEETNDSVTAWFFRATNHQNTTTALQQILATQNRIEYPSFKCHRNKQFSVTCSFCSQKVTTMLML
ncbi:hypothetical protein HOLleu_18438 [Holothuria leucospilota]|uniref:Uncharacterized protein n=1 Tax=Holothuria leucospilota TaxID=206669 RepID=A0A9Q1H944_HOLLE|nr:hypothetical protein HOLleu_18438 [Holothuria leucospilota]